jgi:uncharacterized protein (TIGR02646 family)
MIRLTPLPRPAELTDQLAHELTERFKADRSQRVWNQPFIKNALLEMSSWKCCFCECKLAEEGTDPEVEHFCPKALYPDEVLLWENLLPICSPCNRTKRGHDTKAEPIIHPAKDDPREHLRLESGCWFKGKTELGKTTTRAIRHLNDPLGACKKRWEVGTQVKQELEGLEDEMQEFLAGVQMRQKQSRILHRLESVMQRGQPTERYSATVATEILREDSYHFVKAELQKLGLWDADFQRLEDGLTSIAFL